MKRYVVELGMGTEIHGQDMTNACIKAVRDAMSKLCIGVGLKELFNLTGHDDIFLEVLVSCPNPEEVDAKEIQKTLLSNENKIYIVKGGMIAKGHIDSYFEDISDEIIVANAAITVFVDIDKVTLQK
ncbi:MAG: hypothetical protein QG670_243 [Thermoproteota archaeon]|nr:hypothetical protein [Thermoproteota archaeon]